jgi:hypothetical protein
MSDYNDTLSIILASMALGINLEHLVIAIYKWLTEREKNE